MAKKPAKLEKGMTIGLIAPASAPGNEKSINAGIKILEDHGYNVKLARNAKAKKGFLAGTDRQRISDIHSMFKNKKIDAIACLRGGYGTPRLLKGIDYDLIKNNPKIFIGFSDITGLLVAFLKKSGIVTFHGPMVTSNYAHKKGRDYALGSLLKIVSNDEAFGSILPGSGIKKGKAIQKGRATGILVGGNLSLLVTLLGTPFDFSTKKKILFIEEVGEDNYRVDRMLTQLLNAGKFNDAAGIAFGQFSGCVATPSPDNRPTQGIAEIIKDRTKGLNIPVVSGLPFGHDAFTATLPVGIKATLDAEKSDLIIEESAVK
jgi:muramoyltetrapeptide carboxypeptidase